MLTAAPVLGAVAWAQLYFGGFHAEADAIVMVYEAVAISYYLQMVLSYAGGREGVAALLEERACACCWPSRSQTPAPRPALPAEVHGLLHEGQLQALHLRHSPTSCDSGSIHRADDPGQVCASAGCRRDGHAMDDGGEAARMPINVLNVVSMIVAIRANIALYFEIRDSLAGLSGIADIAASGLHSSQDPSDPADGC